MQGASALVCLSGNAVSASLEYLPGPGGVFFSFYGVTSPLGDSSYGSWPCSVACRAASFAFYSVKEILSLIIRGPSKIKGL